jgi:multidrug resistance efflux pump
MTENQQTENAELDQPEAPQNDPVRRWTLRILVLCVVLLGMYLVADRITPSSSQARVHALVVPIAADVSGTVTEVAVENNQLVQAGDILFRLDDERYRFAVASAEASLQSAREATGASAAGVDAAEAGVRSAEAAFLRAKQDAVRLRRIKQQDPGAISDRKIESANASLTVAEQQLAGARANLEQAKQSLGDTGELNSRIQQAQATLEGAQLNLERTAILAPTNGIVTDMRVNRGNFAGAGAPQMTFISIDDLWVQADFTENNLGHVDSGDNVGLTFDVFPGRVFKGSVRTTGFGVAVDSAALGSLPTIQNNRQWLRDSQRFPVVIDFEMSAEDTRKLKVGSQASAIIYASDNWIFNVLGKLYIRVGSLLSYAY